MYFILNKPVFNDHLSYVTIFQSSLERLHKTTLIVPIEVKLDSQGLQQIFNTTLCHQVCQ